MSFRRASNPYDRMWYTVNMSFLFFGWDIITEDAEWCDIMTSIQNWRLWSIHRYSSPHDGMCTTDANICAETASRIECIRIFLAISLNRSDEYSHRCWIINDNSKHYSICVRAQIHILKYGIEFATLVLYHLPSAYLDLTDSSSISANCCRSMFFCIYGEWSKSSTFWIL